MSLTVLTHFQNWIELMKNQSSSIETPNFERSSTNQQYLCYSCIIVIDQWYWLIPPEFHSIEPLIHWYLTIKSIGSNYQLEKTSHFFSLNWVDLLDKLTLTQSLIIPQTKLPKWLVFIFKKSKSTSNQNSYWNPIKSPDSNYQLENQPLFFCFT